MTYHREIRKKRMTYRFIPGIIAGISVFAAAACGRQPQSAQAQGPGAAPLVEVMQVDASDAPIFSEFPAQTYARNMVEVRGRVEGYIEKWLFKPGSYVQAGQVLYVLDLRPYRAAVQQAEGNVRQSQADLEYARQQLSLLQAEANLAAAEANRIKAQQDYDRLKPLVEQDAAPRQDLDAAVAALRAAESAVRANQANVQTTRVNTQTQIQAAEGKLESLKGALESARLNLSYGTIRAPISGLIGDTLTPVGGLVTPNAAQPLTTIVPLDPIWVRFKVSEAEYLAYLRRRGKGPEPSPQLTLLLADNSEFPYRGRIENALNQVDPKTGTLELQAEFPNPQHALLPGQFGRVRFQTDERKNVIIVPQRAVQQIQSMQTIYTVGADNRIEARVVKTAERVGENWIVEQGLKPGDRIVVEGQLRVRPGVQVRVEPYRAPAGQQEAPSAAKKGD
jgi:membrane fusion protein (multidrug efflux system)